MEKKTLTIDLKDCVAPGIDALNNRKWGIAIRSISGIDSKEKQYDHIIIKISKQINTINSVFLAEFLENVVYRMGSLEKFKQRFSFETDGQYTDAKINYYVEEAVKNILNYEMQID